MHDVRGRLGRRLLFPQDWDTPWRVCPNRRKTTPHTVQPYPQRALNLGTYRGAAAGDTRYVEYPTDGHIAGASGVLREAAPRKAANVAASAADYGEIQGDGNNEYKVGNAGEDRWDVTFTREPFGCKMWYPTTGDDSQDDVAEKIRNAPTHFEGWSVPSSQREGTARIIVQTQRRVAPGGLAAKRAHRAGSVADLA